MDLFCPDIALHVPTVLLPRAGITYGLFAVVACDQYTWQPEYWRQVEAAVGNAPSALQLVLPEVYLTAADRAARIARIHRTMRDYLDQGILQACAPGFVLVERRTARGLVRHGLMVALDLEQYDGGMEAATLIRATEGTVADRLPVRVEIRTGALLEVPHTLVLIDDPGRTVIEPLLAERLPALYEFELMQAGGRLRGWHVGAQPLVDQVVRGLRGLARQAAALPGAPPLLYAVGDGNHSLAAARAIWETTRARLGQDAATHPARYALVELVNVHDQGLLFEPIHRVVQQVDVDDLLGALAGCCQQAGVRLRPSAPGSSASPAAAAGGVRYLAAGRQGAVLPGARQRLEPAALQGFLDAYAAAHSRVRLDYIHGDQALVELAGRPDTVGFLMPALDKGELFPGVRRAGPFPRKTFSLGGADDKRFYLETRLVMP